MQTRATPYAAPKLTVLGSLEQLTLIISGSF